jgi:hypothetical protein
MTRSTERHDTPPGTRVWAIRGVLVALVLLVVLVSGEIAARAAGYQPWRVDDPGIVVEPGGRFFEPHPTLGYRQLPGTFTVRLHTGYTFTVTHGPDTLRATHHPLDSEGDAAARDQIWIFGCSITHGWSVDDDETYPWLLQTQMPDMEVVNFGVNGYGTLHSLIQLREALDRRPKPAVVVLAYAQIHDERNTFTRTRRKSIAPWNRLGTLLQPYARLDDDRLRIAMAEVEYTEFPAMRSSALSHWAEEFYNRLERRMLRSREVTLAILDEFAAVSRAHDVPMLLAGIRSPQLAEVLEWARERGIAAADISVDNRDPRYVNLPHDTHPSPLAHAEFAGKLGAALAGTGYVH